MRSHAGSSVWILPGFFHLHVLQVSVMRQLGLTSRISCGSGPRVCDHLRKKRSSSSGEEAKLATTTAIFGIQNVLPGGVDVSRVGNNEDGEIGRRTRLILRRENVALGVKIAALFLH